MKVVHFLNFLYLKKFWTLQRRENFCPLSGFELQPIASRSTAGSTIANLISLGSINGKQNSRGKSKFIQSQHYCVLRTTTTATTTTTTTTA
jgi:hypothetical protein